MVGGDSPGERFKEEQLIQLESAYTSAFPEALYLEPCSISTDQVGNSLATCTADCLASSMLLTIMRDRWAAGFDMGEDMRDNKEINTVVFPDPVGNETPMREAPE